MCKDLRTGSYQNIVPTAVIFRPFRLTSATVRQGIADVRILGMRPAPLAASYPKCCFRAFRDSSGRKNRARKMERADFKVDVLLRHCTPEGREVTSFVQSIARNRSRDVDHSQQQILTAALSLPDGREGGRRNR